MLGVSGCREGQGGGGGSRGRGERGLRPMGRPREREALRLLTCSRCSGRPPTAISHMATVTSSRVPNWASEWRLRAMKAGRGVGGVIGVGGVGGEGGVGGVIGVIGGGSSG